MFERKEIIVSCQLELPHTFEKEIVKWMAIDAHLGGASFVRVCGVDNVAAVKSVDGNIKVIGCTKGRYDNGDVYITPLLEDVISLFRAGADYVAVDFTMRDREPKDMQDICTAGRIIADVSTAEEGVTAAGAFNISAVATTLNGYVSGTKEKMHQPNILLATRISSHISNVNIRVPVIAEGRFWTPSEVRTAFDLGVDAVCIGSAITNPRKITERFYSAI